MAVKDFFNTHGKDIAVVLFMAVSAYFTIQSNTESIEALKAKDIELEANKVGNSTMILKEQAMSASFLRIDEELDDIIGKLNKKSMLIAAQQTEIHILNVQVSVQQALINQGTTERSNIWENYNRINCK